jgi:hypothetical protein
MPSEVYKKFYKDLDKAAKKAEEEQKNFREAEEKMNKRVKEIDDEATEFEYLNSIRQEDSTRPYNPVEHYKDGGLVSRGQGRVIKIKKTKMY